MECSWYLPWMSPTHIGKASNWRGWFATRSDANSCWSATRVTWNMPASCRMLWLCHNWPTTRLVYCKWNIWRWAQRTLQRLRSKESSSRWSTKPRWPSLLCGRWGRNEGSPVVKEKDTHIALLSERLKGIAYYWPLEASLRIGQGHGIISFECRLCSIDLCLQEFDECIVYTLLGVHSIEIVNGLFLGIEMLLHPLKNDLPQHLLLVVELSQQSDFLRQGGTPPFLLGTGPTFLFRHPCEGVTDRVGLIGVLVDVNGAQLLTGNFPDCVESVLLWFRRVFRTRQFICSAEPVFVSKVL